MGWRRTAAASCNVKDAILRKPAYHGGHGLRRVVVAPHLVGNAGVGVEAHCVTAETGDVSDERSHRFGPQGAVDAECAERRRVLYRAVEGLQRLAGERAPAPVRDRRGNDQRQGIAEQFEGINGGLGVQGVEAGLEDDKVGAATYQRVDLLAVGFHEIVESVLAPGRVVGVGSQGEGLPGGADAAGDIDLAPGGVGYAAGTDRGFVRKA